MTTAFQFDGNSVPPAQALEPIPADWYPVCIEASELKATQTAGGQRLNLTLRVLAGPHMGRKVFDGINVQNANPVSARIGQERLSAICHATGTIQISDTTQLHEKPLMAKVSILPQTVDKHDPSKVYESRNEIKGYKKAEGVAPAGAPPPAPGAAVTAPPTPPPVVAAPAPAPVVVPPPPSPPPAPVVAAPPPPPAAFVPPQGWVAHPTAPGYYYCGQESFTEAQLKADARFAAAYATPPPATPGAPADGSAPWLNQVQQ